MNFFEMRLILLLSRYCTTEKIHVRVSILTYCLLKQKFVDFLTICKLKEPKHKDLSSLIKAVYKPSKEEAKLLCMLRNVPFFIADQYSDVLISTFPAKTALAFRMELACHVGYFCKIIYY